MKSKVTSLLFLVIFFTGNSFANPPVFLKTNGFNKTPESNKTEFGHGFSAFFPPLISVDNTTLFTNDPENNFTFQPSNKKWRIKPFVVPVILVTSGTVLHFSTDTKENFRDWVQSNFAYLGPVDDYIQYAPLAAVYGLNAFGVKGKNNFGNRTALAVKSILLNEIIVTNLKIWTKTERPGGGMNSFPSGHTSFSFAVAHFMHKEFGEKNVWYSVGAYSCATAVGLMRVAKNAHWVSDVLAGAGLGISSTELVYLTHLYKWDNEHIKKLDILPFKTRKQSGVSLVYTF